MGCMFGTDGVRGIANQELGCELAFELGQAAVVFLGSRIVVGRDSRRSGSMLEAAFAAGVTSAGGSCFLAGVIPTPAVALLCRELKTAGGAVISASHNPPEYNGIKLFDGRGFKLPDEREDEIEAFVHGGGLEGAVTRGEQNAKPIGSAVGLITPVSDARERYITHVVQSVQEQSVDFQGVCIALDAAHGASAHTSPEALKRLGAEVIAINTDEDGDLINVNCGSTHLEALAALMEETGADVGIAHDGDADRVLLMAPDGSVIDGDVIEAFCALDYQKRGLLQDQTIVTTVMSNLGLVRAMEDAGIKVLQTPVGDRYVLEAMVQSSYSIGGEQSGHVILLDYNSTGDGLMTACQFLAAWRRSGLTINEAAHCISHYPQVLINVTVEDKSRAIEDAATQKAVREAEEALGRQGRVLLRPSGTEPLMRVMVEASDETQARYWAEAIAETIH